ncbi:MAG: carboxypeptidase-like regulatory domain-containing protein, partial [Flavobacteriaceae bacterium]
MNNQLPLIKMLFLALMVQFGHAQERTVSGVVSDGTTPLPGASVVIKGTTQGTSTDFDGNYSITVTPSDVLVFSYIGMASQEIPVGSLTTINVGLQVDNALDEVVVVGYTAKEKKKLTSSVATVDSKQIENVHMATFD